jgi:hypothetical protein
MADEPDSSPPPVGELLAPWRLIAADMARRGPRFAHAYALLLESVFLQAGRPPSRNEHDALRLVEWLRAVR